MFFIRFICVQYYALSSLIEIFNRWNMEHGTWKCGRYFVKSDNARDNIETNY